MDFYNRHKFVCEITASSGLTFFEAFASEQKEYAEADANFPEALREHILKFLLFNKVTRLDLLVDKIYLLFKSEYFPGEEVYVKKIFTASSDSKKGAAPSSLPQSDDPKVHSYLSTVKQRGVIREKVQYSNTSDTKYLVSIIGEGSQVIATNQQISRDRNHFTKWLIKVFIKMTVTRSFMLGSPWVVKKKYAKKYRILRDFPEEFKQYELSTPTGNVIYEDDYEIFGLAPADSIAKKVRGKYKPRGGHALMLNGQGMLEPAQTEGMFGVKTAHTKHELRTKFPVNHLPASIQKEIMENNVLTASSFQPSKRALVEDLALQFDLQTVRPSPLILILPENARSLHASIANELEEELKSLSQEENLKEESVEINEDDIDTRKQLQEERNAQYMRLQKSIYSLRKESLNSVQEALECWMFLNIYHSVLKLDTFTFDDFIYAMSWNGDQFSEIGRCELLDEIWCALLGAVVSNQTPPSKFSEDEDNIYGLQVTLPVDAAEMNVESTKADDEEGIDKGSESDAEQKPSRVDNDTSDDENTLVESPSRKSLPSLGALEDDAGVEEEEAEDEQEGEENNGDAPNRSHNAFKAMNYRGVPWYERLRKRNFKDGNWQCIVLGVLSLVEHVPEFCDTIKEAFKSFAPRDVTASPANVLARFYHYALIDLRFRILSIIVSLVVSGPLVRNYIEECIDSTTSYRREKLEIYKDLKLAVDNANRIHTEVYDRLMEAVNTATDYQRWALFTRKKHRLNLAGYEMTEYEKDLAAKDPSFQECWNKREAAIAKIKELKVDKKRAEQQLSELDCQRVSFLGKDRHFNRYWWFENNGLPNLHSSGAHDDDDEEESEDEFEDKDKEDTQDETYLMGRLWIQGPHSMDVSAQIKLSVDSAREIAALFDDELVSNQMSRAALTGDMHFAQDPEFQDLEDGGPPLKVMDFGSVPHCTARGAEKLGIRFVRDKIILNGEFELVDRLGALPASFNVADMSLLPRKFIEETPAPLVSGDQWMYFDRVLDLEELIRWLNPWGKREFLLRKELLRVQEGVVGSISARRKALMLDKVIKDDLDLDAQIEIVDTKIQEKKTADIVDLADDDESDDNPASRKRAHRKTNTPKKRQKTTEETIRDGLLTELARLLPELNEKKKEIRNENQLLRVLEWTNSAARDELNKSLYEGGDKPKEKPKKGRKTDEKGVRR